MPTLGALTGPLGPLGPFVGPMGGVPHANQGLLKAPQELHREDIKVPIGGPSAEERLVIIFFCLYINIKQILEYML